jgi:hypothetical protein
MKKYTEEYYQRRRQLTYASARVIVPIILQYCNACSVADFGCADGVWLSVFNEMGIDDYVGFDGPWVNQDQLLISRDRFVSIDFSAQLPEIDRKFDLCSCIEVIEHIHEGQGSKLIDYLCNLSDVILFSAAVPHQGGEGHVNEQRQSYWMKKFYKNGFFAYDIVRKNVWNDKLVNVIYKQNMFLYVSEKLKDINENLTQLGIKDDDFIDIIHPDLYELRMSNTIQKDHGLSFFGKIKRKFFA